MAEIKIQNFGIEMATETPCSLSPLLTSVQQHTTSTTITTDVQKVTVVNSLEICETSVANKNKETNVAVTSVSVTTKNSDLTEIPNLKMNEVPEKETDNLTAASLNVPIIKVLEGSKTSGKGGDGLNFCKTADGHRAPPRGLPAVMKISTFAELLEHSEQFVGHRMRLFGKVVENDVEMQLIKLSDPLLILPETDCIYVEANLLTDVAVQTGTTYEFICDCEIEEGRVKNKLITYNDASLLDIKLFFYTNMMVENYLEEFEDRSKNEVNDDQVYVFEKLITRHRKHDIKCGKKKLKDRMSQMHAGDCGSSSLLDDAGDDLCGSFVDEDDDSLQLSLFHHLLFSSCTYPCFLPKLTCSNLLDPNLHLKIVAYK
ncbi:hypothetical protein HELRODRAFT_169428 [Helobdella robusta]|uniref:Uncharacterized protein n=1 Tax=Helobdella robusta TaxID=6412 RepID=T1F1X2_HELRO|nr:hypothetical protein HELRODRAFT_169428 [Helobdella robusta]ESO08554.1 hypothetical protein HELRODRAFT_169428 [Helobdella robusta]